MSVVQFKKTVSVDQETIESIRKILDAAERGEVSNICFVANLNDDAAFFRSADFVNGWALLGALEYAKAAVLNGMGVK